MKTISQRENSFPFSSHLCIPEMVVRASFINRHMHYDYSVLCHSPYNLAFLQAMLQRGGEGCGLGGATGVFTPMYLAVVRKPTKNVKK